jgi:hypothetical protein
VALRLVPSVRHLVCGQSSQAPNPKEWPPGPWLTQPIACDGPEGPPLTWRPRAGHLQPEEDGLLPYRSA